MRKYILFITALLIVVSCSQYERLRKSSNYALKYRKALEYYNKGEYTKSGTLFDDVIMAYRGTTKADTVVYYQAMSYFKQRDYLTSSYHFNRIFREFPNSPFAEESEYLCGYCYYKQSPRPELDQDMTNHAVEAFQIFLMHHPESRFAADSKRYMTEMQDKLVDKSYLTAKLYFNLSYYKSAVVALNNSLNDYPDTKYREELMFLLLKSSYLLAENSVPDKQKERYQAAVDEYYSFVSEFPQSSYTKEALRMYERSDNFLKARKDKNDLEE